MGQYKYNVANGIKWLVKFSYEDPATGKTQIEYKRGFLTKREAKQYEEDFIEGLKQPDVQDVQQKPRYRPTVEEIYMEYLLSHKREDMKESSRSTKESIFNEHIFPYFGHDTPIDTITADMIAEWQAKKKSEVQPNGKLFSKSYLRTMQSQFNSIINYAHNKGYIDKNPLVDIKNMGEKGKRMEFWTTEEYEQFALAAMKYPYYYYAYEVLYWCGLRKGEMLALTPADIDWTNQSISVNKTYSRVKGKDIITQPKTKDSTRVVIMPDFLAEELKEYLAMIYELKDNERMFPILGSSLNRMFYNISKEANLKHIPLHGLRHSHVSLLIKMKCDIFEVSKRIGHKSVLITQDTYGHLFDEVQKSIASNLNNMRRR